MLGEPPCGLGAYFPPPRWSTCGSSTEFAPRTHELSPPDASKDHHLHIFFEYVPGGSMANFLAEFCCLEGKALWKATRGMLEGLGHLHTRSPPVVHRDLRGANLLIDAGLGVKLADFGCSTWNSGTRSRLSGS